MNVDDLWDELNALQNRVNKLENEVYDLKQSVSYIEYTKLSDIERKVEQNEIRIENVRRSSQGW